MEAQTSLATINSGYDFNAIERSPKLQPTTKKKYKREIQCMLDAGINPDNHRELQAYADGLKSSRKQFLKSALRLMTLGYEQDIKANATPDNIQNAQAAIMRLEAMRDAVEVEQPEGTKAHTWLSQKQVTEITSFCGDDLEGKRDWIVLGLLLGAGLRREELASLTFDALKQQPMKSGKMRDVLEVRGKGAKDRIIPLKPILAQRLREWKSIVGDGLVARSLGMGKSVGESMSAVSIFNLVVKYGKLIGIDGLAAHDCRRTFAQLAYDAGIPITQISVLLGHSNVKTTQTYLNLSLDLETTASDFIPLAE